MRLSHRIKIASKKGKASWLTNRWVKSALPNPPLAPIPSKNYRYISFLYVFDMECISNKKEKTVKQKISSVLSSVTRYVKGVFNA